MVGIKDIAREAGVSISTVSYALNGSQKITAETRERVKAIADELNYVPNMAARSLKRQQTNIIGVYLDGHGGTFYGELLEGVRKGLKDHNYEMIVCSGQGSHSFVPECMIDGAIILDWSFSTEEILKFADRGHLLTVLDREIVHQNVRQVLLDNLGGATLAIDKLMEKKSRKIFLIAGPKESYDGKCRLETSITELERFNVKYEVMDGNFTEESGYQAAEKIFKNNPTKPVDIFSFNDEMAIGIYKYLEDKQYTVGKDVRIIGFDHSKIGEYLQPRLATISYSKQRWGMLAAEKIIQLINGENPIDEYIRTTYVEGDSNP